MIFNSKRRLTKSYRGHASAFDGPNECGYRLYEWTHDDQHGVGTSIGDAIDVLMRPSNDLPRRAILHQYQTD